MPKLKTHKGLKKRVTVSAKGKISRQKAGKGHLLSGKEGAFEEKSRGLGCI